VGYDTSDDAGIYRISDDLALVTTADFYHAAGQRSLRLWSDRRGQRHQ